MFLAVDQAFAGDAAQDAATGIPSGRLWWRDAAGLRPRMGTTHDLPRLPQRLAELGFSRLHADELSDVTAGGNAASYL